MLLRHTHRRARIRETKTPVAARQRPLALRLCENRSMANSSSFLRTYKYRLYPTRAQQQRLEQTLDCARNFYNMCLAERKWAWKLERRSVTKTEQLRQVKHYKRTFPQARDVHSHVLQVAVADLDKAFQAFFRRVKAGEKPGYPRFKGKGWYDSFGLKEYGNGFSIGDDSPRSSGKLLRARTSQRSTFCPEGPVRASK